MNHSNLGNRIYLAKVVGTQIKVEGYGNSKPLPLASLPDFVIAISPTGEIALSARTAGDKAYGCVGLGEWKELGPTVQPTSVVWRDGEFIFARIADKGSKLYEQRLSGEIVNIIPVNTSQGILYHHPQKGWVIKSNSAVTTVANKTSLIKAVERDGWFFGQVTNPDGTAIVRPDGSIFARFKENYEHPVFTVAGDRLVINEWRQFDKKNPPPPTPTPKPLAPKPPAAPVKEDMSYQLEGRELEIFRDTLKRLGAKFPEWRKSPNDDERRKLAEAIAQTLRAKLGEEWGWKSAHSNFASPSKDASAKVLEGTPAKAKRKLAIFDMVNGTTREMNLGGKGEVSEQYFIPVTAKDWLDEAQPEPIPAPEPEPIPQPVPTLECKFTPCNCNPEELKAEIASLRAQLSEVAAQLPKAFPPYEGKLFGLKVRLEPKGE